MKPLKRITMEIAVTISILLVFSFIFINLSVKVQTRHMDTLKNVIDYEVNMTKFMLDCLNKIEHENIDGLRDRLNLALVDQLNMFKSNVEKIRENRRMSYKLNREVETLEDTIESIKVNLGYKKLYMGSENWLKASY